MSVPLDFLKQIPYFAGLPDRDLERIRPLVHERSYSKGEMVILEEEPCEAIYFVKSGRVKVFKTSPEGREQVLRIMRAGDTFNEVPVFDGGPNPASAEALADSEAFLLQRRDILDLLARYPAFAEAVVQTFASRLRQLATLIEDLSFKHVTGRVAKILLAQADDPTGRLTQQQMAAMAGTAREVVGRVLKSLDQEGVVRVERGRVVVLDRARLEELA